MSFSSLGLSESLTSQLNNLGYLNPTAIQKQAIPTVLKGHDVLAAAETGSGKTAGFVLPILEQLISLPAPQANGLHALVLVPTRELAVQVEQAVQDYSRGLSRPVKSLAVYGGVSINTQMLAMRGGCDIVVATPGRLLDLTGKNAINLGSLKTLVLDEADRMLALGFEQELASIKAQLPSRRQNLLFSATFPEDVQALIKHWLTDPVRLEIRPESSIPETLEQKGIEVDHNNRTQLLKHLLTQESWSQVLVFVASKRTASNIKNKLDRSGIQAEALHGDMPQNERNRAMKHFRNQSARILIATDLAARGIDIPALPCVINYDLPRSVADYIHRIGRTARAGESGLAISFVDHESDAHFRLIEKKNRLTIPREQIPGFERSQQVPEAVMKQKGQAPVKGKRKSKKDKLREAAATQNIWQNARIKQS